MKDQDREGHATAFVLVLWFWAIAYFVAVGAQASICWILWND